MKLKYILFAVPFFVFISCVERGKPTKKEGETTTKTKSKIAHYICPNGHGGSDTRGKCTECDAVLEHNQAYHGLSIPQHSLKDPFKEGASNTSNATPSPAQNKYGDYHYICPKGHPGGSGTAGDCVTCGAKLAHNELYHK